MKTPRNILLQKHEAATPRLDQVWNGVASVTFEKSATLAPRPFLENAWHELFWSYRRAWSGFAAVWAVLLVIHLSDKSTGSFTEMTGVPTREALAAFQQEQEFLAVLAPSLTPPIQTKDAPPPALPPRKDTTSELFRRDNSAVA